MFVIAYLTQTAAVTLHRTPILCLRHCRGDITHYTLFTHLTQAELADASDCHEKTIQNLLGGRSVRDQTLFDVCMVLGLDFDKLKGAWTGANASVAAPPELQGENGGVVAPLYMGAYTRGAVDHYFGSYLTLRSSFSRPGCIVAYRTDVTWDPDWPSLLFQERDRIADGAPRPG